MEQRAREPVAESEVRRQQLEEAGLKAGVAPPAEPAPFTAADDEVMAPFIARLRQSWEEDLQQKATEPDPSASNDDRR